MSWRSIGLSGGWWWDACVGVCAGVSVRVCVRERERASACVSVSWEFTGSEVACSHLSGFTAPTPAHGSQPSQWSALKDGSRLKLNVLKG